MSNGNVPSRAKRAAGVIGTSAAVAALGLSAAGSAQASQYATGWQCLSPFANYTNNTYPDDPPAPNTIIDSLAVGVQQVNGDAMTAKAGRTLALRDLQVSFDFKDPRPVEAFYTRTSTLTTTWDGSVPLGATDAAVRALTLRVVPATGAQGPATATHLSDPTPTAKPAAGERWWSYTVANVDPASAPTNNWYSDSAVNAAGKVTRTYYTELRTQVTVGSTLREQAPRTVDGGYYKATTSAVGHKYVTHTGDNRFPVNASVVIEGTNTVEGTQTLHAEGSWIINVQDSTPGTINDPWGYSDGGHTVTAPVVKLNLPRSNWTPNGKGPVEFRLAQPGHAQGVVTRSTGYDRPGYNRPLAIKPFGSVWVRFESESYGSSHDCIPGSIGIANPDIAFAPNSAAVVFGNSSPTATAENPDRSVGDLENPGFFKKNDGSWTPAIGAAGRFSFAPVAQPALAVAPLEAEPAPAYVAKALKVTSTSLKKSKSNTVSLKVSNPNTKSAKYKVTVKTVSKYALTKKGKKAVQSAVAGKTVTVGAGKTTTVKLKLSKAAKTLLKTRKSLKVQVAVTPTDGKVAKKTTKKLTLKR